MQRGLLRAYRWQNIFSGIEHPSFQELLGMLIDKDRAGRIRQALAPLSEV